MQDAVIDDVISGAVGQVGERSARVDVHGGALAIGHATIIERLDG